MSNQNTAPKKTSWANRGKAAMSNIPTTKKVHAGVRTPCRIESATFKIYKTGSTGIEFQYLRDDNGRRIYENVVLYKNTDGKLSPTKFGMNTLRHRLTAANADVDFASNTTDYASQSSAVFLAELIGTPVIVMVEQEDGPNGLRDRAGAVFAVNAD